MCLLVAAGKLLLASLLYKAGRGLARRTAASILICRRNMLGGVETNAHKIRENRCGRVSSRPDSVSDLLGSLGDPAAEDSCRIQAAGNPYRRISQACATCSLTAYLPHVCIWVGNWSRYNAPQEPDAG